MRTMFFKTLTVSLLALSLGGTATAQLNSVENVGRNRIGTVANNGGGSYSFVAGGNDIWANVDEFTYAYDEVAGDFDVRVRVESLAPAARWTKAGIMVRESLAEDSRMLFPRVTPSDVPTQNGGNGANDSRFSYRTGNFNSGGRNGGEHEDGTGAPAYPNAWLRLERLGSVFNAYNSTDGSTWNLLGTQDTATWQGGAFARTVLVGLGASRHSGTPTAAVEFRDYSFTQSTLTVADANSRGNPTGVRVSYSGAVPPAGLVPGNYALDNGATVTGAAAGPGNTVQLTTSTLVEGTTYTLTVTGVGTTPDPATITFTHGAGYEARRIHLARNQIPSDINFFLDSTAYRRGLPVASQQLPALASNGLFEDVTPDTGANEEFSVRISGLLDITTAGDHRFFVSSDDGSRLFLSSDENPANKVEIAREPVWNGSRQYLTLDRRNAMSPENRSPLINLGVGRYYLEMSFSEGGGGNNASAAWEPPGGPPVANGSLPIPDTAFALTRLYRGNTFTTLGPVTIARDPQPTSTIAGTTFRFTVLADGTPEYTYQWRRNGVDIPGATSQTLVATANTSDNGATYSCRVNNEFSTATSGGAVLTVIGDNEPPTLVSANAAPGVPTSFTLVYSEVVNEADAENLSNYSIDNGVTISSATLQGDNRSVLFDVSPVNTPGVKTLTVNNVRDQFGNAIAANSQIAIVYAEGFIQRNFWKYGGGGGTVEAVTSDARFPYRPDTVLLTNLFEDPQPDNGDAANEQFGVQFIGFLTAPFTGNYNFFISADDNASLWLSTDQSPANKVLIAREPGWSGFRQWGNGDNQGSRGVPPANRSTTFFPGGIPLIAGQRYYVECIFSEGGGGNRCSVAWQLPGQPMPANGSLPINAPYLSPPSDPPVIGSGPADRTVVVGQTATFTITATGTPHLHVTWYRNGSVVAEGNAMFSYTTPIVVGGDDGAQYSAVVTNRNGSVTSRTATLTVNPDSTPPAVVSAASFNGKTIGLSYSEAMNPTSISDPINYTVNGVSPTNVVVRAGNSTVLLDMDAPATSPFTVVVNGGTDFAGNPLPANSTVSGTIWATAQDITPSGGPTAPAPGGTNFTSNVGDADVIAGGADIWNNADEFHFIYNPVVGDFDVKVKVQRIDPSNRWAKAGIMSRVGLDAASPTIQAYATRGIPADGSVPEIETGLRTTPGGSTGGWELFRPSLPRPNVWVRLRRNGDVFRSYYGSDGVNWNLLGQRALPGAPAATFLGLATTSHNTAQNTTAEYRNYSTVTYPGCSLAISPAPQSQTSPSNSPVTFSASVTPTAVPANEVLYQWQRSTDGGMTFSDIPGANGTSYTIAFATADYDASQFRLVATAPGCSTTSAAATLTLTEDTVRPRVRTVLGLVFGTNVAVYFSEPMGDAAADNFSYQITDSSMNPITIADAQFEPGNRTRINLRIGDDTPLVLGQQYTVTVNATDLMPGFSGAIDYANNPVDPNPTIVTFTALSINFNPDSLPTLPTTGRLPIGALTVRGFDGRSVDIIPQIGNANPIAEAMLDGSYTDFTGNFPSNTAPLICWYEGNVVNWSNDGGSPGAVPGDVNFPGYTQPTDNIAIEIVAYAKLTAGLHRWAVNSDDGFRVSPALSVSDPNNAITLGEFNGGRGAATTEFSFLVSEDGLYPFRLIWEEGQGGMNLEFWSRDLVSNAITLINGAGGVEVYRVPVSLSPAANLSVTRTGGNVVVSWNASSIGCLEGANSINGPWVPVRGAEQRVGGTKSIRVPISQAMQFYRHVRPGPTPDP